MKMNTETLLMQIGVIIDMGEGIQNSAGDSARDENALFYWKDRLSGVAKNIDVFYNHYSKLPNTPKAFLNCIEGIKLALFNVNTNFNDFWEGFDQYSLNTRDFSDNIKEEGGFLFRVATARNREIQKVISQTLTKRATLYRYPIGKNT